MSSVTIDEAWKKRPIYQITGLSRKEFKEIMKDPAKTSQLEVYCNLVRAVRNKNWARDE